jgi:hypothetical protein
MSNKSIASIAPIGIHIGKVIGSVDLDRRGAIVLWQSSRAPDEMFAKGSRPLYRNFEIVAEKIVAERGHCVVNEKRETRFTLPYSKSPKHPKQARHPV